MMRTTIKLPGVSPAISQLITHYGLIFLLAFGTQMVASLTGGIHISSLFAVLTSAASAGLIAVIHVVLGLIPTQATGPGNLNAFGVSLKVKSMAFQLVSSAIAVFLTVLGAELVEGATHITSLPDVTAVLLAAIMAAVSAVVQYVVGLVPAPKV
jgi:hypothetical protein